MGQEFDDSLRSAGHEFFLASGQLSLVYRVESVHVLVGNYSLNDFILIKAAWQGKLDKDPVDSGTRVQLAEQGFKLVLRRGCGQMMVLGLYSNFFGGLMFSSEIARTGRVVADLNGCEERLGTSFR